MDCQMQKKKINLFLRSVELIIFMFQIPAIWLPEFWLDNLQRLQQTILSVKASLTGVKNKLILWRIASIRQFSGKC